MRTEKVVEYLATEREKAKGSDTERFVYNAYNKVIKTILESADEDISCEFVKSLSLTPKMTEKICSFMTRKPSKSKAVNVVVLKEVLKTIVGIGPKLASTLVRKGVRTVADLERPEIFETLPQVSKLFISLKPERAIKHSVVGEIEQKIKSSKYETYITGSYRRKKPTSRDIDIMLVSDKVNDLEKYIGWIGSKFDEIHLYARGDDKASFLIRFKSKVYKLDVFLTPRAFKYAMLLYSTGSKEFNIKMRQIAKKKGLILNQTGLYKGEERLDLKSEKEYFDILGMKYLEPQDRNKL